MLDLARPIDFTHSYGLLTPVVPVNSSNSFYPPVSLLAATCGRPVKHGNRSTANPVVRICWRLSHYIRARSRQFERTGLPSFSPLIFIPLAKIMPVRRAMGVRTLFNILGPIAIPPDPRFRSSEPTTCV